MADKQISEYERRAQLRQQKRDAKAKQAGTSGSKRQSSGTAKRSK